MCRVKIWLSILLGISTVSLADAYIYMSLRQTSAHVRYTRAYTSTYFNSYYRYYFQLYSTVARLSGFRARIYYRNTRRCANFEANSYGGYLGYFSCPLSIEPDNLKYCCGVQYSHYCCSNSSWATPIEESSTSMLTSFPVIVGITFGGLVAIFVVGGLIWLVGVGCYVCCCDKTQNRVSIAPSGPSSRSRRAVFTTNTSSVSFVAEPPPYTGAPPSYSEVTGTTAAPVETPIEYPITPPPAYDASGGTLPAVS